MNYYDMYVQTVETVQYSWFLKRFIMGLESILIMGVTGAGKTLIM